MGDGTPMGRGGTGQGALALTLGLLVGLLWAMPLVAGHRETPLDSAYGGEVRVDGRLDPDEWGGVDAVAMVPLGPSLNATVRTHFRTPTVCVAFDIPEAHTGLNDVRVYVDGLHDGGLRPDSDDFEFNYNPNNSARDAKSSRQGNGLTWVGADGRPWEAAAQVGAPDRWTAELCFPFSTLGITEGDDITIGWAYLIYGQVQGDTSMWPPQSSANIPSTWGDLFSTQHWTEPNRAPQAFADADPGAGLAPLVVAFSGHGLDEDGTIVQTRWSFGDGQGSDNEDVSHTYTQPGTFTATFTVTDDQGAKGQVLLPIEVQPGPNQPPTLEVTASPTTGQAPLEVDFTATASDQDGTITGVTWDFGDSTTGSGSSVTHTFVRAGPYTITAVAQDDRGDRVSDQVTITVSEAPNQPPTVKVSALPVGGDAPLTVRFSSQAVDTDGGIATYRWDFGDGGSATEPSPVHTFARAGVFTATLTVTDDDGAKASAEVRITVTNPPPDDPGGSDPPANGTPPGPTPRPPIPSLGAVGAIGALAVAAALGGSRRRT